MVIIEVQNIREKKNREQLRTHREIKYRGASNHYIIIMLGRSVYMSIRKFAYMILCLCVYYVYMCVVCIV